jgi:hypothetical protein
MIHTFCEIAFSKMLALLDVSSVNDISSGISDPGFGGGGSAIHGAASGSRDPTSNRRSHIVNRKAETIRPIIDPRRPQLEVDQII